MRDGFNATELTRLNTVTPAELKDGGYSAQECKAAGVSAREAGTPSLTNPNPNPNPNPNLTLTLTLTLTLPLTPSSQASWRPSSTTRTSPRASARSSATRWRR